MEHIKQTRVNEILENLRTESGRYAATIREGNFIDAKAIQYHMNKLQIEMDELLPYTHLY